MKKKLLSTANLAKMFQTNFKQLFLLISMTLLLVIPVSAMESFKTSNYGGGHQIWFEVEDFDARNPDTDSGFALRDEPNDFGKSITNTSGDDGAYMLRYDFDISKAGGSGGTWYFWGRVINSDGRSSFMLVEGHPGDPMPVTIPLSGLTGKMRIFEDHIGSTWTWANDTFHDAHTKTLRDGMNTMYVLAREGGGQMDVFMWTDDPNYVPTDADYENAKLANDAATSSPSRTGGKPRLNSAAQTDAAVPVVKASVLPQRTRPRVIATTDGEVDDRSSMIRFLLYACDFDIAGIVQVNGVQKDGHSKDKWIEKLIEQYDKCLPNLRKHRPDYPDAAYLLSVLKVGNENRRDLRKAPPLLSDSEGAQLIISTLLDSDPRPVHILAWGGANTQANALWQIKENYSAEEYKRAAAKARLYCIWFQDGGGKWIVENLPEVKIYGAGRPKKNASWRYVWDYRSVDGKRSGDPSANPKDIQKLMDDPWLEENVKSGHGALGALYPQSYTSEGDTPSFMPLVDNGLEHHVDYTLGGWGGRAVYKSGNYMEDGADDNGGEDDMHYTFWRWLPAAQNDWAARADWCVAASYSEANHQPVAAVKGEVVRDVPTGQTVVLDASPSTDPDNNALSYNWWHYHEADNATAKLTINKNTSKDNASFVVPNEPGKQLHVILEVTDNGVPELKSYQRVIFNITGTVKFK